MYTVLVGAHPMYTKGETTEMYLSKIHNPKWYFPPHVSALAKMLFAKFVKTNPLERYAAKEGLQHPWITRQVGPIPLSYVDSIALERAKDKLNAVQYSHIHSYFLQ